MSNSPLGLPPSFPFTLTSQHSSVSLWSMELHSEENGDTISVNHSTSTATLGRSNHPYDDLTVSRNHVLLKLAPQSTTLTFEVIGKNPILVLTSGGKKVCRRGEKGELREGDRMSLSIQSPSLWVVVRREVVESSILEAVRRRERRTFERRRQREQEENEELREDVGVNEDFDLESDAESLDFSNIDPVQEFGFLVAGHEFDKYPKGKILPMKNWNWYLDVPKENSDSENDKDDFTEEPSTSKRKSSSTRKKRGKEGEDEDWTGESDEEKDLIAKNATSLKRSKYSTRSKDSKISRNEVVEDDDDSMVQNDEDDGEDDETLGGFIVTGDDEDEEMGNREEEEEEDFEDEEFDD